PPVHQVAVLAGLSWLAVLLRIDAVVSPAGTGLIYLTSGSRILFALSKNGYIPALLPAPRSEFPRAGGVRVRQLDRVLLRLGDVLDPDGRAAARLRADRALV